MSCPVVHLDALPLEGREPVPGFSAAMAQLPLCAGARKLGMRLTEVPPGAAAWPFHCHHVNEEMFVVLAGTGTLRLGAERHAFRAGDLLVCPAGGPETAHQIVNDGTETLRYLAISTNEQPDVYEYPDSGKFGVQSGPRERRRLAFFGYAGNAVDYWDGEA